MSFVSFLASILTITATKKEQILVGGIINYVYIGMESSCLSLFLPEIGSQTVRGFVVSTHQFSIGVGGLIIHIVSKYTSTIDTSRGWKIPIGLFFISPAIVAVGINFVPESPRWYCFNGRYDEGYDALYKYRKDKFTEHKILLEFEKIKSAVIVDQSLPRRSYKELFIKKNLRTVTVIMIHVFQQITGQAFASQYGTIFVKSLNSSNAFTTSIISSAVAIFGFIICIVFSDIIGTKALFYIDGFIQTGALLTMG